MYPTAGRQLRLSVDGVNDMGHWAPNSSMPQRYDAAACVSELIHKNEVVCAVRSGWDLVDAGCVPLIPESFLHLPPLGLRMQVYHVRTKELDRRTCQFLFPL